MAHEKTRNPSDPPRVLRTVAREETRLPCLLLEGSSGLPLNPASTSRVVRTPIVPEYSEAPEEDGEYGPRESGPGVVPDRDEPKIDDYVDGKVPSETIACLSYHPRPS